MPVLDHADVGRIQRRKPVPEQRRCYDCGHTKVLDLFVANARKPGGRGYLCKECRNTHRREQYTPQVGVLRTEEELAARRENARRGRAADPSANTAATGEWRKRNPKKRRVQRMVQKAVADGALARQLCEVCGNHAEAHHDDYDKPLDVRWLCTRHHNAWHVEHGEGANAQDLEREVTNAPATGNAGAALLVGAVGQHPEHAHCSCATEPGPMPTALGVCVDGRATDSTGKRVCDGHALTLGQVILGANAAEVVITFQSAMCQMLIQGGICPDEPHARAHLAAMLLSPDTSTKPGSLVPLLQAELAKLDDGKWIT